MSEKIEYRQIKDINGQELQTLYENAGWTSYTANMQVLLRAVKNSLFVVSAWDENKLIGLLRAVGDGEVILYIQDILVLDTYKRKGIGRKLMETAIAEYKNVRQYVLLTEDTQETRLFYESLGFTSCDKGNAVAFTIQK